MTKFLLGLDAGNTVVKAVLFDLKGKVVGAASAEGRSRQPEPGHVERDIAELWRGAADVIARCLKEAGASGEDVAAVGTAGHGNGLYLLDKQNQPLLGIQSLDTRAAGLATELRADGRGDRLYAQCLQKPWPSQTATLLAWIKRHRPEIFAQAGTAFLCKDALTFLLTGERVSDFSDMSGCGLLLLPERRYDPALLEGYGIGEALGLLPDLVQSDRIAGRVTREAAALTRLAEGTPVAAGFFDVIASMIGAGTIFPGEAAIVAGTWGINQVILEAPLVDDRIFHASTWRAGRYVSIESSATSAVSLEWFVREFADGHGAEAYERCNALVASVEPAAELPIFLPFLYGSATHPNARGAFVGLSGWHGKAAMLHAIYEGVIFEHRRHIDRLRAAGARFDKASLSGGGSRSAVWCQMFADQLDLKVTVADCSETGALGAAIAGGVAAGIFPDLETGVAGMVRVRTAYEPRPERKTLSDARYRLYRDLAEMLPERWAAYGKETRFR
ncbi:FGGY-family carbohydrate kinase [Mesorhizobium sp. LHD-90]|uniref:FGGY-family carbohydrate kinase n=1 Tax=Mesorhizobium sp. LHD-90 TaxID=3071414 RepID=UPI0027E16D00|nr:FGGY-family carbohydrate kinase [Mesorhizobium sp. LHD-90]MDQ6435425.1 FGGY-family carbohydrate kinase [Mesorhizobium sp. LHD-90]